MTIETKLAEIQSELHAPKTQRNEFGKYNYRSCEDILSAAKPICGKHGLALLLSDEIKQVGDRFYLVATATVSDGEHSVSVQAFAREPFSQKGMSDPQLTGATSSYARKYALNGLFAIDDSKDADSEPPQDATTPIDARQKVEVLRLMAELTEDEQGAFLSWAGCATVNDIETGSYERVVRGLKAKLKAKTAIA